MYHPKSCWLDEITANFLFYLLIRYLCNWKTKIWFASKICTVVGVEVDRLWYSLFCIDNSLDKNKMTRSVILQCFVGFRCAWFVLCGFKYVYLYSSSVFGYTGARKQIFEWIVPASKLHQGEEANIWIYGPRFQVSPGSRSKYLYVFAPAQNFQDIENNISNVYLSKVLPTKRV